MKTVTITVFKAYVGYRADCDSCKYISIQHADEKQAIKAAAAHGKQQHPKASITIRRA